MNFLLLSMPVVAGIIAKYKGKSLTIATFVAYIFAVCGYGYYYNNVFRMGYIFPADIYLLVFTLVFFVEYGSEIRMLKNKLVVLFVVCSFQLCFGCISGFEISDILTDIKYVLYFFIPYMYLKTIYNEKKLMKQLFNNYIVLIVISLMLNWQQFFLTGLNHISIGRNDILRTFGIGLGFQCGALAVCLLMNYKEQFLKNYSIVLYYAIQVVLIVSAIASFTRTWWISFFGTIILNLLLVKNRKLSLNSINTLVINMCIVGMLFVFIVKTVSSVSPAIIDGITERFFSISKSINGTQTEYNTFNARINNIMEGAEVLLSPQIFWGYGYGSLYKNLSGYHNGCENSFIYYIWKYGIVAACFLYMQVLNKVKKLWNSQSLANRTFVVYFLCEIIIGSLSGNYNNAWGLGMISFMMGMNYQLIFDEEHNVKESRG